MYEIAVQYLVQDDNNPCVARLRVVQIDENMSSHVLPTKTIDGEAWASNVTVCRDSWAKLMETVKEKITGARARIADLRDDRDRLEKNKPPNQSIYI